MVLDSRRNRPEFEENRGASDGGAWFGRYDLASGERELIPIADHAAVG